MRNSLPWVSIVLSAAIMLLAACGGDSESPSPTSSNPTDSPTAIPTSPQRTPTSGATEIASSTTGSIALLPYGYEIHVAENGFSEGSVFIAFRNVGYRAIIPDPIDVSDAVVEITEEARTYPVDFFASYQKYYGSPLSPLGEILADKSPLPPGFTTTGTGDDEGDVWTKATFKVPTAGHPRSLHITGFPDVGLSNVPTSVSFATDVVANYESLANLAGRDWADRPGHVSIVFTGACKLWNPDLINDDSGGLAFTLDNKDDLGQHSGYLKLPIVVTYFNTGRISISTDRDMSGNEVVQNADVEWRLQALNITLGPGQAGTLDVPFFNWSDGAIPLYLMVIPYGQTIDEGFESAPIYRADCQS